MRKVPFGKPIVGQEEKDAAWSVIESGIMVHGPHVTQFEADFAAFTGAPHALTAASCTAALHLFNFLHGIGPGDEVIVPAQTHVATAHAVELVGAKPVFVDAEASTGNIDVAQVAAAVTARTKAISVVHYLGLPVDMDAVNAIAKKHGLLVLEDCALAIGSWYKGVHCGLLGDAGCFSFYPVKHMTTAEGGMLTTRHADVAEKFERLRAFGVDRQLHERKIPGEYDVPQLGLNYRMNEIEASMGVCQLKRVPGFLAARKRNYQRLTDGLAKLPGISLLDSSREDVESSYYCHAIILDDELAALRLKLIQALKEKGVGTSIYYPKAVPILSYYANKYGYKPGDFPVAERISNQSIALPVGPHLDDADVDYVVAAVASSLQEVCHG